MRIIGVVHHEALSRPIFYVLVELVCKDGQNMWLWDGKTETVSNTLRMSLHDFIEDFPSALYLGQRTTNYYDTDGGPNFRLGYKFDESDLKAETISERIT